MPVRVMYVVGVQRVHVPAGVNTCMTGAKSTLVSSTREEAKGRKERKVVEQK